MKIHIERGHGAAMISGAGGPVASEVFAVDDVAALAHAVERIALTTADWRRRRAASRLAEALHALTNDTAAVILTTAADLAED